MCYSVDSIDLRGIALNKVKSDKLFHMCNGIGKLTVNEQDKALVEELIEQWQTLKGTKDTFKNIK